MIIARCNVPIDDVLTPLAQAFQLFRDAIALVKDGKALLSDRGQRETLESTLEEAERASRLAEAQIAKALGYHLCRCTFPPQIMLSIGYRQDDEGYPAEYFQCLNCRKEWPPPAPRASTYTDEDEIPHI